VEAASPRSSDQLRAAPFDGELWTWAGSDRVATRHRGRDCIRLEGAATLAGVELVDGAIEVELSAGPERGFHGLSWRIRDDENFESFFVRPHQVGNPDAVQYTPVFNGISSWQLYHGPGFWAPIEFPLDDWFRIRVVFSGDRAEVYVADLDRPALVVGELKGPVEPGHVGVFAGPAVYMAGFAYDDTGSVPLREPRPAPATPITGVVPAWWISDAYPEEATETAVTLDGELVARRTWTRLTSEPSGLVDLSRVNGVGEGRDTTLARAVVGSARRQTKRLELGFSDRAVVFLNGRAVYRGDNAYRSRDYRFLGSIGYYDTLYLPLEEGDNELVVAVSETFGGWGIQARFPDLDGLSFE
jgi:hypothetical protein